jgi:predicted CoA-binding protein
LLWCPQKVCSEGRQIIPCRLAAPISRLTGVDEAIAQILGSTRLAVTGVSRYSAKFGHRIYHFLSGAGYQVSAVNPNADCIEEAPCFASLSEIPNKPECVVTVTQPWITTGTVKEAIRLGIPNVWMQPGSESREAIAAAEEAGLGLVYGGPCIMVEYNRRRPN